jgi:hypothetical protein
MATLGGLVNSGLVDVENGSTLLISGDVNNSGTLATDSIGLGGGNKLTFTGALTNTGIFELLGHSDMATLGSLTNNASGFVDVEGGSTLTIAGDVTNSGAGSNGLYTSFNGTGGNTLIINGVLTNNGMFGLEGPGDMATISGNVTNNSGATIALTGGSMATFDT